MDKSSNNMFVLPMASAFVMLKIRPVHLVLVGLTVGRSFGRPSADEKVVVLEIFKIDNSTPDVSLGFLNLFLALVWLY